MYAIAFDFDTTLLEQLYPSPSWRNAYGDVRSFLGERGFEWRQGRVHFGNDDVTAVDRVRAVQKLASKYPWFGPSLRDIRMLRIEENNDLAPAINDMLDDRNEE